MSARRTTRLAACFAALPAALAACAAEPVLPPALERAADPILGGQLASEGQFPAVVAILLDHGDAGLCTGTLVHPEWVLTAGHCLDPALTGVASQAAVTDGVEVLFDTLDARTAPTRSIEADATYVHPDWGRPTDPDVGLIHLATSVTDIAPMAINFDADAAPAGVHVDMVGYGLSDGGTAGRKLYLTDKPSTSCSTYDIDNGGFICFARGDGKGQCRGDSGGPSFATIDGVDKVVGIISFSDEDCQFFGAHMRTDDARDFIVATAPELDCQADGACNDACGRGGLPRDADCPVCAADAECGDAQECDDGLCVAAPLSPGGLGAECGDGRTACESGLCGASGDERRCTRACDPADEASCPEGFACVGEAQRFCWVADDEGGGCAAGGAAAGWSAAVLALVALLAGRRRARAATHAG